jgi:holo-[acyl-carrier protein] synthase
MIGLGCDIIEINRIKSSHLKFGTRFLDKVFTINEQNYCLSYKEPYAHLAVRFAAKEAVVKALGTGFRNGLSFLDIEIINDAKGKPEVFLSERIIHNKNTIFLTLSHCKEYALAVACIQN